VGGVGENSKLKVISPTCSNKTKTEAGMNER
jgi:hypothetical protein